MKVFDPNLLPSDGAALLTAKEIDGDGPMYLADFRDMRAIKYIPTGHYLGYVMGQGIKLCKGPLKMVDGLWVAVIDEEANRKFTNIQLGLEVLDFVFI